VVIFWDNSCWIIQPMKLLYLGLRSLNWWENKLSHTLGREFQVASRQKVIRRNFRWFHANIIAFGNCSCSESPILKTNVSSWKNIIRKHFFVFSAIYLVTLITKAQKLYFYQDLFIQNSRSSLKHWLKIW
jgi:hypothetical protein